MAGKGRISKVGRKRSNPTPKRRRPGNGRSATKRMSVPSFIFEGAKTLVGSIPGIGPLLANIADFGFKALGITKTPIFSATQSFAAEETEVFGLGADMVLPMATPWKNSELCTVQASSSALLPTYQSAFTTVKLVNIQIKLLPSSKVSDRQGEWAMVFVPFLGPEDILEHKIQARTGDVPTFNGVCRSPGAVYGSASRPLVLNYSTRSNAYLQMFHSEDTFIGALRIAYQDTLRDRFIGFTASEVAPEVQISGHMIPGNMARTGMHTIQHRPWDNIQSTAMSLVSGNGHRVISLQKDANFKCIENGTNCKVTGQARVSPVGDFTLVTMECQ